MSRYRFFSADFLKARLISRPNRFVVILSVDGQTSGASLPNPGKLGELFVPGAILYIVRMEGDVKYPFRVIAVESESKEVIMLDTHRNNRVAEYLLDSGRIPSLAEFKVRRREVTVGRSRFDFLLENKAGDELYCEVKSCTLFGGELAMFPDAVTERGRRHVEELGRMSREGIRTAVLFIVQSASMEYFCPDYHTDPLFSETLYKWRESITIIPVTAGWDQNLDLVDNHRELPVLWNLYETEGRNDSGLYMMLFRVQDELSEYSGLFDSAPFHPGYYLFVSREDKELRNRIERYRRKRKKEQNVREYLRNNSVLEMVWPVRSSRPDLVELNRTVGSLASEPALEEDDFSIFYFADDPRLKRSFQNMILEFRMKQPLRDFLASRFD